MKKQTLTFSEKLKIHDHLKRVLTKNGDIWQYAPGVDDHTVGEMFGVKPGIIIRLRQEAFGEIRTPRLSGPSSKELETRVTAIEEYLTSKNPNWRA